MKNTVENNNPRVSIGDDGFGVFVYDKSKPINISDLKFVANTSRGKSLMSLWMIPYMLVENYRKGNLTNEQFSNHIEDYELYLKNFTK